MYDKILLGKGGRKPVPLATSLLIGWGVPSALRLRCLAPNYVVMATIDPQLLGLYSAGSQLAQHQLDSQQATSHLRPPYCMRMVWPPPIQPQTPMLGCSALSHGGALLTAGRVAAPSYFIHCTCTEAARGANINYRRWT